ncbi:MAG: hypothetical protein PHR53_00565 [Bacteroidales bacterium]|nr:hypothetical protein [Bacteroidales bacterium]
MVHIVCAAKLVIELHHYSMHQSQLMVIENIHISQAKLQFLRISTQKNCPKAVFITFAVIRELQFY